MAKLEARIRNKGSYSWKGVEFDKKGRPIFDERETVSWAVRFTDADGNRTRRTFKKLADAQELLLKLQNSAEPPRPLPRLPDAAALPSGTVLPPGLTLEKYQKYQELQALPLSTAIQQFSEKKSNLAENTRQSYFRGLAEFSSVCTKATVGEITDKDVIHYRTWLYTKNEKRAAVCESTAHTRLNIVSIFLTWAGMPKILDSEDWPELPDPEPDPFTEDEITALLEAANPDERLLFEFMLYTGLRKGDVATITKQHISSTRVDGEVVYTVSIRTGKRNKVVQLPLFTSFVKRLYTAREGFGPDIPLFPRRPLIGKIVTKVAERAGVAHAYPHRFRDTAATRLASLLNTFDLMERFGWSDAETASRYVKAAKATSVAARTASAAAFGTFVQQ